MIIIYLLWFVWNCCILFFFWKYRNFIKDLPFQSFLAFFDLENVVDIELWYILVLTCCWKRAHLKKALLVPCWIFDAEVVAVEAPTWMASLSITLWSMLSFCKKNYQFNIADIIQKRLPFHFDISCWVFLSTLSEFDSSGRVTSIKGRRSEVFDFSIVFLVAAFSSIDWQNSMVWFDKLRICSSKFPTELFKHSSLSSALKESSSLQKSIFFVPSMFKQR